MHISSRNDTQSILSIARQSALAKASKEESGSEGEASAQTASTAGGVSYSQGYSSFQSTLATASVAGAAPTSGAERIAKEGGLISDALTKSDWDFIEKTTGLTYPGVRTENWLKGNWLDADGNGISSGPAFEQANALLWAMSDMRVYAAQFGTSGDMFQGTGEITPGQLREYFAKYQGMAAQGAGPFSDHVLKELDIILSRMASEPS